MRGLLHLLIDFWVVSISCSSNNTDKVFKSYHTNFASAKSEKKKIMTDLCHALARENRSHKFVYLSLSLSKNLSLKTPSEVFFLFFLFLAASLYHHTNAIAVSAITKENREERKGIIVGEYEITRTMEAKKIENKDRFEAY